MKLSPYLHGSLFSWPLSVVHTLTLLLVLGAAYCFIVRPAYNIIFHPLRNFPGPKLWAATDVPFTRMSLSGAAPMQVLELHKRYGHVVRIRPNELSFIDPVAWKDLMGQKKAGQEENGKDPAIVAGSALRDSILGAERDVHARFRRALAPGFSTKAVLAQESLIQNYVDLLIRRLHEQGSEGKKALDLRFWFSYFTFDVISDLSFGEPFGCLDNADYHPWVAIIIRVMQSLLYVGIVRRYIPGLDTILPKITPKKVSAAQKRHGKLTKDKVAKRLALSTNRADFMDAMLNGGQDGNDKLSLAEIESNASVLIVAGSETTATALAAAAYYLCRYPDVLARLTQEVRSKFSSETEIDVVAVGQLKYLIAVLDEVLRIYPPAPWSQPRQVRLGGETIAGEYVPEGTIVGIWQWAVFHSPENFKNPDNFLPERWLGNKDFIDDRREAFQPFSAGPRDCIGRNLAYAEMRLVLAKLVWNFDLRLAAESQNWTTDSEVYLVWKKPVLNVHLTPRVFG